MTKANGKPPNEIETWVKQRLDLRDWIEQKEKEFKEYLAPYVEFAAQLDGQLLEFLDASKIEMARTEKGTVYVQEREYAQVKDPEALMQCVRETGLLELLQARASAPACREYAKEYDSLPPGVSFNVVRSAIIRRA